MDNQPHPDSRLIDDLGGTAAVARMFEVRSQSVSEWRRDGIPKARLQTLRLMRPDLFPDAGEGDQETRNAA